MTLFKVNYKFNSSLVQKRSKFLLILLLFYCLTSHSLACQPGNKQMSACLHRYLERDFSIVEDLLRRPPYGDNGHILIEENELDLMCSKVNELKNCYESMFAGCIGYAQYAHMKRILKIMRAIYESFCGAKTYRIKALIEGGYCIELMRKESSCSSENPHPHHPNETLTYDPAQLHSIAPRHRWPYTLTSMMRFELGRDICPYLNEFNKCLTPILERRCREDSRTVWKHSMDTILEGWCSNSVEDIRLSFFISSLLVTLNINLWFIY